MMEVFRDPEVFDGDEERRSSLRIFENERLCPDSLGDAFGFSAATAKSVEPDGVVRGDILACHAYLELGRVDEDRVLEQDGEEEDDPEHSSDLERGDLRQSVH